MDAIDSECIAEKDIDHSDPSGSNSLKTYIQPNLLWSTHYIHSLNSEYKSEETPNGTEVESRGNPSKDEIRIEMECQTNFSFVTEPMGVFSDPKIRNDFIRKVYSILCIQITVTTIIAGLMFTFLRDKLNINELIRSEDTFGMVLVGLLGFGCSFITFAIFCAFCCCPQTRRIVPLNYILLSIFTVAEAVILGIFCSQYYGQSIIIAFIITAIVVLAITLLATTPFFDITNCGLLLCLLAIIHGILGPIIIVILVLMGLPIKPLYLAFAFIGAFLFSVYLLYDTQRILGGKQYELSPEEYIEGAIVLYIDIVHIFIYILQIVGFNDHS